MHDGHGHKGILLIKLSFAATVELLPRARLLTIPLWTSDPGGLSCRDCQPLITKALGALLLQHLPAKTIAAARRSGSSRSLACYNAVLLYIICCRTPEK